MSWGCFMKITSFGTKKAVMIPSLLLPLIVATAQWVCFTSFVCRYESKSSADDSNYPPWNQIAQKILENIGRNWWLTDWGPPCILWWWAWILIQIDTGSPFPRGESPPQHTPQLSPRTGVSKDAPRGSPFVVICDYLHTKAAAKTGTPIPRIFWTLAVSNST